ncbi:Gfo/Idh/MocA family protein [Pseudalkalibacillus salsuginis]|uniref:Gfo/Idh/MocA family protein n=1 Tax=Pseudalkalibacillus salsuginis TaxID=2910972 RepID=UPI001F2E076A|nr:Gfo/Idh/MocA family oxidoreductase [Pseudalkalibacillus salsuginis]MCF6409522.1 Gfo/Idh/MocA family oxidoreductase [Pseudalkalibacillus salsuginis]
MKIGIISFAHMHAYSYARSIQRIDGVELAGIADDNVTRGTKMADTFQTDYYRDVDSLLSAEIEAVIVTSENVHHVDHVTAAAEAGKHILCEKPLATNTVDAKKMVAVCKENGVILQTAFPVRFNTSIIRAKELVEAGKLGRILAMKGTNRGTNPGGWFIDPKKSGGGAVMDHTVHVVDVMRWLMKAEVNEVYAEVDQLITEEKIDDCGILTLEFTNGVFATLDCSWNRNKTYPTWGDVTLEIIGTDGMVSIDAFAQKVNVYSDDKGLAWDFWGDDMDFGLIQDFVTTVLNKREPSITGEDGMRAVEVAIAAYESASRKKPIYIG